jgi:hypothetical protein
MSAWERFEKFTSRFMDRAIVVMQWASMGVVVLALVMMIVILAVLSIWG